MVRQWLFPIQANPVAMLANAVDKSTGGRRRIKKDSADGETTGGVFVLPGSAGHPVGAGRFSVFSVVGAVDGGAATSCCAMSGDTRCSLPLKTSLQLPQRTRPPRSLSWS